MSRDLFMKADFHESFKNVAATNWCNVQCDHRQPRKKLFCWWLFSSSPSLFIQHKFTVGNTANPTEARSSCPPWKCTVIYSTLLRRVSQSEREAELRLQSNNIRYLMALQQSMHPSSTHWTRKHTQKSRRKVCVCCVWHENCHSTLDLSSSRCPLLLVLKKQQSGLWAARSPVQHLWHNLPAGTEHLCHKVTHKHTRVTVTGHRESDDKYLYI